MEQLLRHQQIILKRAHETLVESRKLVAERENAKRRPVGFDVGDKVMLKSTYLNCPGFDVFGKHLKPPFVGPFEVERFNKSKTAVHLKWDDI